MQNHMNGRQTNGAKNEDQRLCVVGANLLRDVFLQPPKVMMNSREFWINGTRRSIEWRARIDLRSGRKGHDGF